MFHLCQFIFLSDQLHKHCRVRTILEQSPFVCRSWRWRSSQVHRIYKLTSYIPFSVFFVSFSKFYCCLRVSHTGCNFVRWSYTKTRHSLKLETCESFSEQTPSWVLLFIASSPAWPETYPLFENVTSFVVNEKKTQNIVQSWKFMVLRVKKTFWKFTQEKKPFFVQFFI